MINLNMKTKARSWKTHECATRGPNMAYETLREANIN